MPTTKEFINIAQKMKLQCQTIEGLFPKPSPLGQKSNFDKNQKLKIWQNPKLKLWQNFKIHIVTKLKKKISTKTKKKVTKLKNARCDITQIVTT